MRAANDEKSLWAVAVTAATAPPHRLHGSMRWWSIQYALCAIRLDTCYRLAMLSLFHIWASCALITRLIWVQRKRSTRSSLSYKAPYNTHSFTHSLIRSFFDNFYHVANRAWVEFFFFVIVSLWSFFIIVRFTDVMRQLLLFDTKPKWKRGALMLIIRHSCARLFRFYAHSNNLAHSIIMCVCAMSALSSCD